MKARHRINSAFKNRSGHDAHVVAITQRDQVLLNDEGTNPAGLSLDLRYQLIRLGVVLIDPVNDFGNDLVLERVPSQVAMIAVVWVPLLMQRQGYRVHLAANPRQIPLRGGEHRRWSFMSTGAKGVGKDLRVDRRSCAP